jgi:hypothetical protein
MSGTGKVFVGLGLVVLLIGFVLAALYFAELSQQMERLSLNLSGIATENAGLAAEVSKLEEWNSYQSTQIGAQQAVLGQMTTTVGEDPGGGMDPTFTPTAYITLTPWDRPVGVMIEDGACCAGGTAGETIEVLVQFLPEQSDLIEPATEMRVITGVTNVTLADMANVPWQPVVGEASYEVYLPINWTTFWVHVQYRSADGSVSAIYSDEIGVEGMPPQTETP